MARLINGGPVRRGRWENDMKRLLIVVGIVLASVLGVLSWLTPPAQRGSTVTPDWDAVAKKERARCSGLSSSDAVYQGCGALQPPPQTPAPAAARPTEDLNPRNERERRIEQVCLKYVDHDVRFNDALFKQCMQEHLGR